MAYYAVIDDFRAAVPHTVLAGGALRPRGLAGHTTEGGEGEAGFLGTVDHVLIAMPERSAGYHEGWYPKNGGFEARRITRPEHAAHSMNPRRPPWRDPPLERVRRILGDRWWDPNAVSYAIAIAGSTGVTIPRLVTDPGFMAGARRRYAELQQQFATSLADDPLFNHGEGQTDRSDWGTFRAALLAPAPEEADMPTPPLTYVPQLFTANADGAELREQADLASPVVGSIPAGTLMLSVGEDERRGVRWRYVVAGEPPRLLFVARAQITEHPAGSGRDQELFDGIAAVVDARAAGQPVPSGGIDPAVAATRIYEAADATARAARRHADGYRPS